MLRRLSAVLIGLTLVAGVASAHEGHDHKVMGTVTAIDDKHIEVAAADGQKTSVELNAETKYLHGDMAAERSHVTVGQRVVVLFRQDAKSKANVATEVKLGVADKKPMAPMPDMHHH